MEAALVAEDERAPLVEMRNIKVAFGGVHAVDDSRARILPTPARSWSTASPRSSAIRATPRTSTSSASTSSSHLPITSMRQPTSFSAAR